MSRGGRAHLLPFFLNETAVSADMLRFFKGGVIKLNVTRLFLKNRRIRAGRALCAQVTPILVSHVVHHRG